MPRVSTTPKKSQLFSRHPLLSTSLTYGRNMSPLVLHDLKVNRSQDLDQPRREKENVPSQNFFSISTPIKKEVSSDFFTNDSSLAPIDLIQDDAPTENAPMGLNRTAPSETLAAIDLDKVDYRRTRIKKLQDLADSFNEWEDESMKKNHLIKPRVVEQKPPASKIYKRKSLKTQVIRRCLFTPLDVEKNMDDLTKEEEGRNIKRESLPKRGLVGARAAFFEKTFLKKETIRPPKRCGTLLKQNFNLKDPNVTPDLFKRVEPITPRAVISPVIKRLIDNLLLSKRGLED